jgi:transcriptional regulator with XRE-family HTH domain
MPRIRDTKFRRSLGIRIKARRQWLEGTQADLGKAIGVGWQMIQKYEAGTSEPPAGTLLRLARALKTSCGALLDEPDATAAAKRETSDAAAFLSDPNVADIIVHLRRMEPKMRRSARNLILAMVRT